MHGKVGVGYRIFNNLFFALALKPNGTVNDYAMIRSKVSEFVYQPILDNVQGLALRKENWTALFEMNFFKKNYSKPWCRSYV